MSTSSDRPFGEHGPGAIVPPTLNYMPTVVETTARGEREWNIFSRLLRDRIIFLGFPINDDVANVIIAQMLFLESEDPDLEVSIYLNSPGGYVNAGLAIYDTMQLVRCPISTICVGQAASIAAMLLAGGAKGKRFALPHARSRSVNELGLALGIARPPIDFPSGDDRRPIHLICLIAVPAHAPDLYLALLAALARTFADVELRRSLLNCASKEEIYRLLSSRQIG